MRGAYHPTIATRKTETELPSLLQSACNGAADPGDLLGEETIFDPEEMIFDREEVVFDPEEMIFDQEETIFDREEVVFDPEEIVFDK